MLKTLTLRPHLAKLCMKNNSAWRNEVCTALCTSSVFRQRLLNCSESSANQAEFTGRTDVVLNNRPSTCAFPFFKLNHKNVIYSVQFGGVKNAASSLCSPGGETPLRDCLRRDRGRGSGSGLFYPGLGGGLLGLALGVHRQNCRCRFHRGRLFSSCLPCLCSVYRPLLSTVAGHFSMWHNECHIELCPVIK